MLQKIYFLSKEHKKVRKQRYGYWREYNRVSGPYICQELGYVLVAVKVVDVGQALPSHKHQGQHRMDGRWLREKEALDKPHWSGSGASTNPDI